MQFASFRKTDTAAGSTLEPVAPIPDEGAVLKATTLLAYLDSCGRLIQSPTRAGHVVYHTLATDPYSAATVDDIDVIIPCIAGADVKDQPALAVVGMSFVTIALFQQMLRKRMRWLQRSAAGARVLAELKVKFPAGEVA